VTSDSFDLRTSAAGPYRLGELGSFNVTLTTRPPWHVNQEYPTRIELVGPTEVQFPRAELGRPDAAEFTEERARFAVPFTPAAAGSHRVEAKVSFAVCTDESCVPADHVVSVLLPVQ